MHDYIVPGEPVPKGSWRVVTHKRTGKAQLLPDSTEKSRRWVRAAKLAIPERVDKLTGPVAVFIECVFSRPKSVSEKRRPEHTVAPDADKLARQVLDVLTGRAIKDDCLVIELHVQKRYAREGEVPFTGISLGEVAPLSYTIGDFIAKMLATLEKKEETHG